jgi:hypothetical protein
MHNPLHELLFGVPDAATEHITGEDSKPDFDLIQPGGIGWREMQKLFMDMTVKAPSFNSAFMDQKGCQEASCPMPSIGIYESLSFARAQRQHWLSPVNRLDLGFFVNADNEGIFRRTQIKPEYACLLFCKLRVRTFSAPVFGLIMTIKDFRP